MKKAACWGKKIKLVDYDDANSSEQAASIAEKIVGDETISAVLGHFSSGVAMTAAEVYQEAGIALVNGSAAHMDYAKIGDLDFPKQCDLYHGCATPCFRLWNIWA